MKRFMLIILVVASLPTLASYTYIVTDGMECPGSLTGTQSLLMTGGGGDVLTLLGWSSAVIQRTAPYNQVDYPRGGIHQLSLTDYAHLDFSGGEVYELGLGAYATAVLSGGEIGRLRTGQTAWRYDYYPDEPPALVPNPHVEMIVKETPILTGDILTGHWANNTVFNIQLVNVSGYSPTIEDIKFTIIPEPTTLLLLGFGCLIFKHKK